MPLSPGDYTMIGLGLGNIAAWIRVGYNVRQKKNGNSKPCPLHAGIESRLNNAVSMAREDNKKIFDKLEALAVDVATIKAKVSRK
jgi:hypothetical protein